ncbi:putative aldo keto reductase protein [Phaeoacremonium minimum UCRPA7]|uniref:Putative aldo keto reductase protein n=1 Tax=Phaeoacremonium minimum (strain UCR-PA7) TaxID=1286976 RepID=R8BCC8_PHAM7|nr:putative aldo keto reductase protein [Phaeoacremonium minimum UCRPA7]EON96959.1 putative aldo keto reductase protein [Phaeoacremonium minimum UCRPA7]
MASQSKTALPIVFGAMTFGDAGIEGVRVSNLKDAGAILDTFQAHGHREIDTARLYGAGSSEKFLGELDWQGRGLVMATKVLQTSGRDLGNMANKPELIYTLQGKDIRRALMGSLAALGATKIDLWYLHGPDRITNTPLEETLREVNTLHKEGYFSRFGISNFTSWEVAKICEICNANGWVRPVVFQGLYNAVFRGVEQELLPCLRHYGIAFYSYQPLAGGFLTTRYRRGMADDEEEAGSRFDPKRWQGGLHRALYWHKDYFDALEDIIRPAIAKHGLTEAECALRWVSHHSPLSRDQGDTILIGASSVKQLEHNLIDLEKGPLPGDVVKALDAAWTKVKGVAIPYHH